MDARNRSLLRVGLLANIFEWYEFSVFGFLADLIGQLFFESSEPIIGLMRGFMLFATSYLIRPLGGLFFGLMGDRIGQGPSLRLSLILMSVPTILIGLLPTYGQIGIAATLCLFCLRLIQGFAAGGELPSSGLYIFEGTEIKYRSLLCSAVIVSGPIGMLLASLVIMVLSKFFDQSTLLIWAWRIPFLLGIPLTLLIAYIRQTIHSPISAGKSQPIVKTPLLSKIVTLKKPLMKAGCLVSFMSVCFYIFFLWMPSYLKYFLAIPSDIVSFTNILAICIALPFYGLAGYCAQRFGYRNLIVVGMLGILLICALIFKALQSQLPWENLLILQLILILFFLPIQSTFIEMLVGLFPTAIRSLGVSLAWSLPPAFIGSTTPLVCSYMIHKTGWLMFPAFYIMFFGLLALPVALRLKASSGDLSI